MNTWYMIPARKGSQGFKLKNRDLLPITVNQIPPSERSKIIVSTDDEYLIAYCKKNNLRVRQRPEELATNTASLKDVIVDVVESMSLDDDDNVVVLFPTFPQRTFSDIQKTLKFMNENDLKSCTGKKLISENHPYLCFESVGPFYGKKVVDHSLYRRQDYPESFGLCHLVCVTKASEAYHLDDLLVNNKTGFRWCADDLIDVDYKEDFLRFSSDMTTGIERFNPRAFETEFDPFVRHFERYFQSLKLLGKTGKDESWLDCACGSGYGTSLLTNFASKVTGYDIDKNAVGHAKSFYGGPFCEFTDNNEDLKSNSFDVIFSIETIEHMPLDDASTFLENCNRMLRDDGYLIITTPIVDETNYNPTNEFHFFECSFRDFVLLLKRNGLAVLDDLLVTTTFTDGETKEQGYFKCQNL